MKREWKKLYKVFTITLKFWDEFYANFVLLYFSSDRSIKIWHLYFKNVKKKATRQYIRHQNIFNIKKHHQKTSILKNISIKLKKCVHLLFVVIQTNLHKAVNILHKLSQWIRNKQMMGYFNTKKAWVSILHA